MPRPATIIATANSICLRTVFLLVISCQMLLARNDAADFSSVPISPLTVQGYDTQLGITRARLNQSDYFDLRMGESKRVVELPLNSVENVRLNLERFSIVASSARFLIGSSAGSFDLEAPDVVCYRGRVAGEESTHAFFAVTSSGMAAGYMRMANGQTYFVSQSPEEANKGWSGDIFIHSADGSIDFPDGVVPCAVEPPAGFSPEDPAREVFITSAGMRMAYVAIDSDEEYYQIFNDVSSAQGYALMVLAAVSDIYMRDFNMKLLVKLVRIWPSGGEPFEADDLGGFGFHWSTAEDPSPFNYVHMFSGRRDLPYGGVAYVGGTCSGGATFGISGFLNGSFPMPFNSPGNSNWDVIVVAHEMGHNSGTYHTHDGYTPTIDDCGNGSPSRGTIMSYCHIFMGYTSNIDLWMHTRIEEVVEAEFESLDCYDFDCNDNDTADALDISSGSSIDSNLDGIPDECQDCNGNFVLDDVDIAGGAPDINGNGIPDLCESDCNSNGLPDQYEIALAMADDADGNNIPDDCDPNCNNNFQSDWVDVETGFSSDFDRNAVPDECQDCNNNGKYDWIDLGRQDNLYITDQSQAVREYHQASGYLIRNISVGGGSSPTDAVFNLAGQLLVSDQSGHRIMRIEPDTGTVTVFVTAGLGGLSSPTFVALKPSNGNLLVSSRGNSSVIEYNSLTGALVSTLVTSGSGGLANPFGIATGPNGNLFVASGTSNSVMQYDLSTGAFINVFVSSGSGGLSQPRGIAFLPNGDLLVASMGTNQILRYDGTTGSFVGVFNDLQMPSSPFGLKVGPNGDVFVSENSLGGSTPRVIEFRPNGRFYRRYVRGDNSGLIAPAGFAFRPASPLDCNHNNQLDICDIAQIVSADLDLNGIPDECETTDTDGDGVVEGLDNCPGLANSDQFDMDWDGVGDVCDNCPTVPNSTQVDTDLDDLGDACDNCKLASNSFQENFDGDIYGDVCDACPTEAINDFDNDGLCGDIDNCPNIPNLDQLDSDDDGLGDLCDVCPNDPLDDADGDGACGDIDNCPTDFNPSQADADSDSVGDVCDNCQNVPNPGQEDANMNGIGDVCDYVCGDADGNGLVSISDAVFLINFIFAGGPTPNPVESGDADCNSILTVSDAVFLINFIFGGGPAPCSACP